jgi:hypothetical protein
MCADRSMFLACGDLADLIRIEPAAAALPGRERREVPVVTASVLRISKEAQGGCEMRRLFIVVAAVAVLAAGGAIAGEVKGPPNQIDNTNTTGALDHANSACAASGLNDFDTSDPDGQNVSQVQTAADSWKYYGLPHGFPGIACRGN